MRVALVTCLMFDQQGNEVGSSHAAIDLDTVKSVVPSQTRVGCVILNDDMIVNATMEEFVPLWADKDMNDLPDLRKVRVPQQEDPMTRQMSVEDVIEEEE